MPELHISIAAEKIFTLGGILPVTNSILTSWIVIVGVSIAAFYLRYKISLVPGKIQLTLEIVIEGLYNLFASVLHDKAKIFFPLLGTLFIYILLMNWAGLLPGIGTIGLFEEVDNHNKFIPLFRSGTADLNTTLGLALISVIVIQLTGIKTLGMKYLKKFINFQNPMYFFVGILEAISEVSKIISFAFRLFGNIFAGEVLLTVMAFLIPIFVPIPFLGLELFVGVIQALVFSMLTSVFLSLAISKEGH